MPGRTFSRRALLAGVGTAGLLTACGGEGFSGNDPESSSSSSAAKEAVTLRMLANITPNLSKSFWRELVAPYEKANDVTVSIEAPTGTGVKDSFPQLLAAGDPPDVVETLMADPTLAQHMLDLTGESWVKDTPLVEQAALDGKLYTVGVGMQAQSLVFYNTEVFAKAGVTAPPQHLDELTTAMGKLKSAGYLPLQTAGTYVTGLQLLQLCWPSLIGGAPDWYERAKSGGGHVGHSLLPYLELYKSWLDASYIDKNALGLKDVDAQNAFFGGKAAMYVMGSWLVSTEAQTEKSFEVDVFSSPTLAGQPYPGPMGATMAMPYLVLKGSEHSDAAKSLVRWLVTDRTAVTTALKQDGNFRPGFDWATTPVAKKVGQLLADAPSRTPQGEGYGDLTLPPGFNTEFNEAVQGLYIGRTPQQVASDLDAWLEAHA